MLLNASRRVINACALVESLLELGFRVGPLINEAVLCSFIICLNSEDSFITGASSQVSCWQCVSGTFSTAAGALRVVILCDDVLA